MASALRSVATIPAAGVLMTSAALSKGAAITGVPQASDSSITLGMPTVMLESLACGTPVIAAPFESAAEVINTPAAGMVATERSAEAIASAWLRLRDQAPAR